MRSSTAKLISSTHPTLHFAHPTLESFIWNTLIRAHVQAVAHPVSSPLSPFSIYHRMRFHGVQPDFHTYPFLLQFFNNPSHFKPGQQIHAQSFLFGLSHDPFIQTSLITMYSACGNLNLARQFFDEIVNPDLPSWNTVVNAYMKVGLHNVARDVFDKMPERNVVSWSCMINGYVKCGEYKEALDLFREMQMLKFGNVRPNEFTMSAVLTACGRLGALEHGKWAHAYIDRYGMVVNVVLGTSLIDMYAKCGCIERARSVFTSLGSKKDVKAWSAMISGFAMHGHAEKSLEMFRTMTTTTKTSGGVRPNDVTFLGVLCACVHRGLLDEGKKYFDRMSFEFGITPSIRHYGCMVDLYGRAGRIDEAWRVIRTMPMEPDALVWGALMSGARVHGNVETCELALKKLIVLDPENSGAHVLLSNAYAKMGKWSDASEVRRLMEEKGIEKVPGCSLVEIGGVLREFFAGRDDDTRNYKSDEIYLMLDEIMKGIKMEGYVENTNEVLVDRSSHSEMLAIAFCFLKTSKGTPIRIVKNLRICGDCHDAIKMISKVFGRDIVVRDCNRFHHFKQGLCSCKDYW